MELIDYLKNRLECVRHLMELGDNQNLPSAIYMDKLLTECVNLKRYITNLETPRVGSDGRVIGISEHSIRGVVSNG